MPSACSVHQWNLLRNCQINHCTSYHFKELSPLLHMIFFQRVYKIALPFLRKNLAAKDLNVGSKSRSITIMTTTLHRKMIEVHDDRLLTVVISKQVLFLPSQNKFYSILFYSILEMLIDPCAGLGHIFASDMFYAVTHAKGQSLFMAVQGGGKQIIQRKQFEGGGQNLSASILGGQNFSAMQSLQKGRVFSELLYKISENYHPLLAP